MAAEKESKTEPATPKRRSDARKKGRVCRSPDLSMSALLLVVALMLWTMGAGIWEGMANVFRKTFAAASTLGDLNCVNTSTLLQQTVRDALMPVAPLLACMLGVVVAVNYAQVGFAVSFEPMQPKPEKFNPVSGFSKLFSPKSLMMLATSGAKLLAVFLVGSLTLRGHLPGVISLYHAAPMAMGQTVARAMIDITLRVSILLVILAVADYLYQKWQYEKDLRMTKEEVKEEAKMSEGSPETRQRIRSVQLTMARNRMISDVKKADVIVRNPTHYAVALKYDPAKSAAPLVLAKGADYVALRIIEEAKKHRVPTVHDKPLAQALYKSVKVGEAIPPKLYRAVAKLLVHIFRRRRGGIPRAAVGV